MNALARGITLAGLMVIAPLSMADQWRHGISGGFGALDLDGDLGFNTKAFGPIDVDFQLDPGDVMDSTSSAIGIGGISRTKDLSISYGISRLDLDDDVSAVDNGIKTKGKGSYETLDAKVIGNFTYARAGSNAFGVIFGARHTSKEFEIKLNRDGVRRFSGDIDEDWTDVVMGLSHTYAFSETLAWTTGIDYGFGESDGTVHFSTGINKMLAGHWLVGLTADYMSVDYENGSRGDNNWFKYDVDETRVLIGLGYMF